MEKVETFEIPSGQIDVKRLYLPVEFQVECPKCRTKLPDDFDQQCLSYPAINELERRGMYCDDCDLEFSYSVKLQVSLEQYNDVKIEHDYSEED